MIRFQRFHTIAILTIQTLTVFARIRGSVFETLLECNGDDVTTVQQEPGTFPYQNIVRSYLACLHDQNKSGFLEGRLFSANQGF